MGRGGPLFLPADRFRGWSTGCGIGRDEGLSGEPDRRRRHGCGADLDDPAVRVTGLPDRICKSADLVYVWLYDRTAAYPPPVHRRNRKVGATPIVCLVA